MGLKSKKESGNMTENIRKLYPFSQSGLTTFAIAAAAAAAPAQSTHFLHPDSKFIYEQCGQ